MKRMPVVLMLAALVVFLTPTAHGQSFTFETESCPFDSVTVEGGAVSLYVGATATAGQFQSLDLIALTRDGIPDTPVISPILTGLDSVDVPDADELIVYWVTQPSDAGQWVFSFEAANDLGDADTVNLPVRVDVPDPDHIIWRPQWFRYRPDSGQIETRVYMDVTTSYDSTFAMTIGNVLKTVARDAFLASPILDPGGAGDGSGDILFPPEFSVFESRSTVTFGNDGISGDSVLFGLVDFGGTSLGPGTYTITLDLTLHDREGIVTAHFPQFCFPPASICHIYNVSGGGLVYADFAGACWPVLIARDLIITGDLNGTINVNAVDIIYLVSYVFKGGPPPLGCVASGDADCSGAINAADVIRLVDHVFKSGPKPCDINTLVPGLWSCP